MPRPGIFDIDLYHPGESTIAGGGTPIKLSSNETPLGPSAHAVEAFRQTAGNLARYPDGSALLLRQAIAGRYGLDVERIVCGAGSDELLTLLASAYLQSGDEAIYTKHGFLVYRIAILANSATPVVADETDELKADVDAILAAVTDRTRLVFLANPNNPTGTYLPIEEVRRLRSNLPDNVVLVLDGAYAEYVQRNDYEAGLELVATTNNTVMTRTFSKIHGLAALRIGWAYCPANIAEVLNRIRGPFNLSSSAIAAGAASIQDTAHIDQAVAHNDKWLAWLTDEMTKLGLVVTPSVANFILVHFPETGPKTADAADAFLRSQRIIVRKVGGYQLPHCLRMTIGTEPENQTLVVALKSFMQAAQGEQA